jgi:uncharacterized membrane protein YdjX (TVP38/TMEM64 family)
MKKIRRYIPFLIIVILSFTVWLLGLHHYLSFDALRSHYDFLETYKNLHPITSVCLFIAVYIAVVGLSVPGATLMTIFGGLLFGQVVGTCTVVVAATIGATILFISAKFASQDLLKKKAGPWIDKMKEGFNKDGFYYLLTLRLIPIFPFVAINLVAAVFQVPLKTFVIATFVGIIPGSFVYVSIGNALKEVILLPDLTLKIVLEPKLLLALTGLGVLSLLPVLYKRLYHR